MRATLVALSFAAGCSGYMLVKPDAPPLDPRVSPPPGWAQVCIVRPHWISSAVTLAVRDNDTLVGATRGPSYFCYLAEPGVHHLVSTQADPGALHKPQTLTFAAVPNGTYVLEQRIGALGIHDLAWVAPERVEDAVSRCGYRLLTEAPDGTPRHHPPVAMAAPPTPG